MSIERSSWWRRKPIQREVLPVQEATLLPPETTWKDVKKPVIEIFDAAFSTLLPHYHITIPQRIFLKKAFTSPENTIVIQKNVGDELIGWACAQPIAAFEKARQDTETAYITDSAVHPTYQRKGIIWGILDVMEETLKERGYTHIETHALNKRPGWPQAIEKRYKDRIVEKHYTPNKFDSTFFRIEL